jgi:hypothetical protein
MGTQRRRTSKRLDEPVENIAPRSSSLSEPCQRDGSTVRSEVVLLNDLVPKAFRRHFFDEIRRGPWTYGRVAYSTNEEFKGWGIPVYAHQPPVRNSQYMLCVDLFRLVQDQLVERGLLMPTFRFLRIGADGRTDGQYSYVHTDGDRPNMLSVLYYANDEWSSAWGGPTQFYRRDTPKGSLADDPERADYLVDYYPGRFACFPSMQPHASTPPRNGCRELRVTVSFVLENPAGDSSADHAGMPS